MMKRVFVIHGWMGSHREQRYVQLKKKLENKGFEVYLLKMPNPEEPRIEEWVPFLKNSVGVCDAETYFVGNSVGCQTILRYLEGLAQGERVGGAVFSAGWVNLKAESFEDAEDFEIARPWIESEINWTKVRLHSDKFVALFSDDDPYVPIEDVNIFEKKLGAKCVVEHAKGHFPGYDNGAVLKAVLEIAG